MVKSQSERAPAFKDFYQVLQLQPDADSEMVDQAYWHLARVYNAASATAPWDRAKLDELNEAYSVLRSSALRQSYDRIRASLLGRDAPPTPPRVAPPRPPLTVMRTAHAKERSPDAAPPKKPRQRPMLSLVKRLKPGNRSRTRKVGRTPAAAQPSPKRRAAAKPPAATNTATH